MTLKQDDLLHKKNFGQDMTYKNRWLQRAANNFDEIYSYYKLVAGENTAKRRLSQILQATDILEVMPNIGKIDEEFPHTPCYRYLIVLDYRIYYFVDGQTIYIAAIWDCRQGGKAFNQKQ